MSKIITPTLIALSLVMTQLAHANIQVNFYESAPKDSFVIKNMGNCALSNLKVEIDLSKSDGRLIFDTTATGAGVEVFQPFEVTKGDIKLASKASVKDGDASISLSIPSLPKNNSVSFTIDVDDTLKNSELGMIRVSGSEIKNAKVSISVGKKKSEEALFGSDSKATVTQPACKVS